MIHFMVDFENVRNNGLQGAEYLQANDKVTIFYSACCLQVENGRMQQILNSGCEFDIRRLQNTGKNALDFYIASYLGELFGSGFEGNAAIVSCDKGFRAVQEYWRSAPLSRKIVLKSDIEQCIVSSGENSERSSLIREKKKTTNIECEFEKYQERKRILEEVKNLFENTAYTEEIGKISSIIERKSSPKVLYLDTLKQFGKKSGLEIYSKIKNVV